ncbi:hypothetical protein AAVH_18230 [Aphelenchoides avenae]|nr:hypothetical protein AAVH_18230 [Aphelenchus avenae]
MVPLLDVLAKHFGKTCDEVTEIIASDISIIDILLADWNSKFKTQRELVESALTEWTHSYLRPKYREEYALLKEVRGEYWEPTEKYPEEAARFFCFFPFNEYFYAIGHDYDHLKKDYSSQYGEELVAAMKHDFGITIKYPDLPLFGAKLNNEVDYWPIEVIQVSIAVPLMLNLMQ